MKLIYTFPRYSQGFWLQIEYTIYKMQSNSDTFVFWFKPAYNLVIFQCARWTHFNGFSDRPQGPHLLLQQGGVRCSPVFTPAMIVYYCLSVTGHNLVIGNISVSVLKAKTNTKLNIATVFYNSQASIVLKFQSKSMKHKLLWFQKKIMNLGLHSYEPFEHDGCSVSFWQYSFLLFLLTLLLCPDVRSWRLWDS